MSRSRGLLPLPPLGALVPLMKLRLNSMVVFAVGAGALMAPGEIGAGQMLALLAGVLLSSAGTSALNQSVEHERDRLMDRTVQRPIPAGLVTPLQGFLFGSVLSLAGLGLLLAFTTWQAMLLTAATVVSYVAFYTPLKPRTTWNTLVGAIPGALPPLVGWAAVAPLDLGIAAWSLFLIIFFWQFPHFFSIATLHREDYRRAGFAMLPVHDPSGTRTVISSLLALLLLIPACLLPFHLGITGPVYAIGAVLLSLGFLVAGIHAARRRDAGAWRALLRSSFAHLPATFILMALDRVPLS